METLKEIKDKIKYLEKEIEKTNNIINKLKVDIDNYLPLANGKIPSSQEEYNENEEYWESKLIIT